MPDTLDWLNKKVVDAGWSFQERIRRGWGVAVGVVVTVFVGELVGVAVTVGVDVGVFVDVLVGVCVAKGNCTTNQLILAASDPPLPSLLERVMVRALLP